MVRYLLKMWKNEDGDWIEDGFSYWEPFATAIVVIVGVLVFTELFSMVGENVLRIVAPDYMAAREIIGLLKP